MIVWIYDDTLWCDNLWFVTLLWENEHETQMKGQQEVLLRKNEYLLTKSTTVHNRCPFIKTSQSIKLPPVCLLRWIVFWLVKSLLLPLQSSSELTNQNFYSKSHVTIQFTFWTLADTNVIVMLLMVYKINFMSCLRYRWRVYFKSVIFIASWWVSCCCAMHMFLICFWIFVCERIMIKV